MPAASDAAEGDPQTLSRSSTPSRWVAAAIAIFYGFAKLTGSQFTILESQLDRPLGSVSGFWLTWYYFGYSQIYGSLIALLQIVGGWLLLFPRTYRLGAAVLLPAAVNILLVDIFYGIDLGGLLMAALLTILLSAILAPSLAKLLAVLTASGERVTPVGLGLRVVLVLVALAFTYWTANYNNRFPTPIDGAWMPADSLDNPRAFDRVFFERNRAHMVVFRYPDGRYVTGDFRLETGGRLLISPVWLRPSSPIWEGTVEAGESRITLWSVPAGDTVILYRFVRPVRSNASAGT